ncbi:MAG TPA: hypothetical protein VFE65_15225 [Pseudonocardia sp.]|jgi:hypothetical protein|nr:hypothetical protein [Pseudonocardia sp.]
MATYPPVTDRERDAALARITARHLRREDTRWSEANSDSDTAAYDVLHYLRRRHAQLPVGLTADNVWDELTLSAWIYWDQRRRERELLHRARRLGLSLADLARYVGIGTRQGMRDYLDRVDALLADYNDISSRPRGPATGDGQTDPLARIAGTTRAQRGADVHTTRARRAATRTKPARQDWITTHHSVIVAVVTTLLVQSRRVGSQLGPTDGALPQVPCTATLDGSTAVYFDSSVEADPDDIGLEDYLSWLGEDLEEGIDPGTFGTLGLALGELRTRPEVLTLPRNHGLRLAIGAADRLRADYAELAGSPTPASTPVRTDRPGP